MGAFRYKAFISYSHADEAWGRWLHKALESYRVPRRLVGKNGLYGAIPARVAPVFRDREDLSSSADLGATVTRELEASETLVVICSPAAAASEWVNREVEYFRKLGREDRILGLIVDGEPGASDPSLQCFPPAMVQEVDGLAQEPLAADARKDADGKVLARLKLVAGILGIRLDDLRQRDMQRKHRQWMISSAAAMTVAIVTTILAVVAITARDQAENRRQHAENLVDYMVDDLKDKLDEVGRLDILEGMGDEVSRYLGTLNPREETAESLLQKAKVLRQLGEVAMSQDKLDDAMTAFAASREVTRELLRRQPDNLERIFEMSQAEFWVGYVYTETGEFDEAEVSMQNYLEYSNRLAELDPRNPEWIMEQSYAHGNIAALINRGEGDDVALALDQIKASVELNWRAIELDPNNEDYISEYGEALAWQADTQLLLCDLGGAMESRQENVRIARESLARQPSNMGLRQRYAYSLSGFANVARKAGANEFAMEHLRLSIREFERLYQNDASNVGFRWDQLIRESYVVLLNAEQGDRQAALARYADFLVQLQQVLAMGGQDNHRRRKEFVVFLLHYAEMAWLVGESQQAERLWEDAARRMTELVETEGDLRPWTGEIALARFLKWHFSEENSALSQAADLLPPVRLDETRQYMSCDDRNTLVLQALVEDNRALAQEQTAFLLSQGFFEPGFVRICREYDLCQGPG